MSVLKLWLIGWLLFFLFLATAPLFLDVHSYQVGQLPPSEVPRSNQHAPGGFKGAL